MVAGYGRSRQRVPRRRRSWMSACRPEAFASGHRFGSDSRSWRGEALLKPAGGRSIALEPTVRGAFRIDWSTLFGSLLRHKRSLSRGSLAGESGLRGSVRRGTLPKRHPLFSRTRASGACGLAGQPRRRPPFHAKRLRRRLEHRTQGGCPNRKKASSPQASGGDPVRYPNAVAEGANLQPRLERAGSTPLNSGNAGCSLAPGDRKRC